MERCAHLGGQWADLDFQSGIAIFVSVFCRGFRHWNVTDMDIELFASLLKDLILDNERVTLPGLGAVESFVCPSVFTDRGYTLQPPYRQLSFSDKEAGDTLLVDRYAAVSGVVKDAAEVSVRSFTASIKEALQRRETVDIPGLGRLRSTLEGNIFIVCDEDLDIYPEGLGLLPVSLKNNRKEVQKPSLEVPSTESVSARVPETEPAPALDAVPEPKTSEPTSPESKAPEDPVSGPAPEPPAPSRSEVSSGKPEKKMGVGLKVLIWTAAAAAALLAALAIAGRVAPGLVDPLLYSAEEMEIINHG